MIKISKLEEKVDILLNENLNFKENLKVIDKDKPVIKKLTNGDSNHKHEVHKINDMKYDGKDDYPDIKIFFTNSLILNENFWT